MKVKCIETRESIATTEGKIYEVISSEGKFYWITNDNSKRAGYNKRFFVECEKEYTLGEMIKEYEGMFVGKIKRIYDGKELEWRRDGVLIWSCDRSEFKITQFALAQKYTKIEDLEVTYIGALKELEAGKETYCIYEDNKTYYDSSSRAISLEKLYKGKWYIKA